MVVDSERAKLLRDITAKMSEEVALVLTYLYINNDGRTVAETMADTKLDKNRTRLALILLDTVLLIEKSRIDRCLVYSITEDGKAALRFMLDETAYPGRKIKLFAILNIADADVVFD